MAKADGVTEIQETIAQMIAELAPGEWTRAELKVQNLGEAFDSVIIYWDPKGKQFYPKGRGKLFYEYEKLRDTIAAKKKGSFKAFTMKMSSDGEFKFDYKY